MKRPMQMHRRLGVVVPRCEIQIFNPKDVILERRVGSVGVMTVSSSRFRGMPVEDSQLSSQIDELQRVGDTVQQEGIEVRQYEGRLKGTSFAGENVFVKMYPKNIECDALAANELKMHDELQPPHTNTICDKLAYLIGAYQTDVALCLVFRRSGKIVTLGQYVQQAANALQSGKVVGSGDIWDVLDPRRSERRRHKFMIQVFRQIVEGLDFMHTHFKLHQSLGPESVTLSNYNESDISKLNVQIRDLAFGVDVSDAALAKGMTLAEIWDIASDKERMRQLLPSNNELFTRARDAGAWTDYDKRNYGIADDVSYLGLLLLYAIVTAFSSRGTIDGPRLYRLVQTTFDSDVLQFRDYCCEDDAFKAAIEFLDMGERAGWELIQALIQQDWKSRPTAASCLNHPFLDGSLFESAL